MIRDPLTKNGLGVMQDAEQIGESIVITTLVTHISGEWIEGKAGLPIIDKKPQAIGSLTTYGRRYGIGAMLGISAQDEDDDGEKAEGRKQKSIKAENSGLTCDSCGVGISDKVATFSIKQFNGTKLCMACQKTFKPPVKASEGKKTDKPPF